MEMNLQEVFNYKSASACSHPELAKLSGQKVVVKLGGSALDKEVHKAQMLEDIAAITRAGVEVVLVHGGGPAVSKALQDLGKESATVRGLRVTDAATLTVVTTVMTAVNQQLVDELQSLAIDALGICAPAIKALYTRKHMIQSENGEWIDVGWVGEVTAVQIDLIDYCLHNEVLPVVAPIGIDSSDQLYNINADHAAMAVAGAISADSLVFVTDVPGILQDANEMSSRLSSTSEGELKDLISKGVITGGMIPKAENCIDALEHGVKSVQILDGRQAKSLLAGLLSPGSVGTRVTP